MAKRERKKKAAVDTEATPDPETATPEATAMAEAVAGAAQAVVDAQANLQAAREAHTEAVANLAEAAKPPAPEFGVHLLLEGLGRMDMPTDWHGTYQFRLLHNGGTYDHVSEDAATGVWIYRKA